MSGLVSDFKRAWRLTKLIRETEINDKEALLSEKVETLCINECRSIKASLDKARKSLNRNVKDSRVNHDKRFSALEDSLSSSITKLSQFLEASQKAAATCLGRVEESSQTTQELVNNVREYVAKQAVETRRWQEGYDWKILKNYLLRVVSTLDDIEAKLEFLKNNEFSDDVIKQFNFLLETLEIHLEEEGMTSFSATIGAAPESNLHEIKASVVSENEEQEVGSIAEVIRKGYKIYLGAENKVVRKAQVTVYKK